MPTKKRKKVKPLWGAQILGHGVSVGMMFGDDETKLIAELLGTPEIADKSDFLHGLIMYADAYWYSKAGLPQPTRPEIKAALDCVAGTARDLRTMLTNLDVKSKTWMLNEWIKIVRARDSDENTPSDTDETDRIFADQESRIEVLENATATLGEIVDAAERTSEKVVSSPPGTTRRGRKRNDALHELIESLWEMYQLHENKELRLTYDPIEETYKGPFFDLVRAFLGIIDPDHNLSDTAIGDVIRRALKKLR